MRELTQVTLKFRPGLTLGDRAFWKLCRANPDLRLERTAGGELEIMAPAGSESGGRNGRLTQRLGNWSDGNGTGKFFDSSAGFTLPNGATRSPDASWLPLGRWLAIPPEQREAFAPICPDFVAEIRSPGDSLGKLRKKMREYIAQGARLGWLIDPERGEVEVYRPGRPVEVLTRPATLSGEGVLPGFVLDLKGILFD
jgi:Uma2 family endonuclease